MKQVVFSVAISLIFYSLFIAMALSQIIREDELMRNLDRKHEHIINELTEIKIISERECH